MNAARDESGPAGTGPEPAAGLPAWLVIHSGTAESAETPAARAVMRTSDGEFRITASHVDGKVGLTIEMLKPESAERAAAATEAPEGSEGSAGALAEDDEEDLSPTIRSVLSPNAVPRPRRADRDGRDGREDRASEAA